MQQRISPDPAVLDALHANHSWIPSSQQIRPSRMTRQRKNDSPIDDPASFLVDVFGHNDTEKDEFIVCDQPFPYDVSKESRHLVAWMMGRETWSDEYITRRIRLVLRDTPFVWYENPKKSFVHARVHHVQVFAPNFNA